MKKPVVHFEKHLTLIFIIKYLWIDLIYIFFKPGECTFTAIDFKFKRMSVRSSLTPGIVENSCTTPLIFTDVIAAPCKDRRRGSSLEGKDKRETFRNALKEFWIKKL